MTTAVYALRRQQQVRALVSYMAILRAFPDDQWVAVCSLGLFAGCKFGYVKYIVSVCVTPYGSVAVNLYKLPATGETTIDI